MKAVPLQKTTLINSKILKRCQNIVIKPSNIHPYELQKKHATTIMHVKMLFHWLSKAPAFFQVSTERQNSIN